MAKYRIDEDVKLIRELLNLSQRQFAERIAADATTLARWETGKIDSNENSRGYADVDRFFADLFCCCRYDDA